MDYKEFTGYKGAKPNVIREELRDANGRQKTEALFEEAIQNSTRASGYEPIYSLREYENNGKPSAYLIYINSVDESDAAIKLVGSYAHWRKLCSLKWFINGRAEIGFEGLASWRKDMAERDKTIAKVSLMEQAEQGNISAAKALDKIARDDEKAANKILPRKGQKDQPIEEDSTVVEFLNDYKGR
jgi:hypothetical protein